MVNAIGLRHINGYTLTGERFDAHEAVRIGLIHKVVLGGETEAKSSFLGANHLKLNDR